MYVDRRLNIVNMSVFPSLVYRLNPVPVKIPRICFVDSKVYIERENRIANKVLNKVAGLTLTDF